MSQMNLFDQRAESQYCSRCGTNPCTCNERDAYAANEHEITIDERFEQFSAGNPHVLTAALQIARDWLARGDKYISVKAIYENLRVRSSPTTGEGGYKLNNDFTAPLSRWLITQEPRLEGVLRMRERKTK